MAPEGSTSGFDVLVIGLAVLLAVAAGTAWAGATLALLLTGHTDLPPINATADAIAHLVRTPGDPAGAWPAPASTQLPGPVLYWLCTALVAGATITTAVLGYLHWGGPKVGTARRRPLGVDGRATWAQPRDLRPLLVKAATPGRFILGRVRRHLVATEAPPERIATKHRTQQRHGDRGAVALIGPSRCGKTVAAVGGILEWEGPAILSSVKADLLAATHGWRTTQGDVRVFDPTATLGHRHPPAIWSPIAQADTTAGAQRAARALCDAAPRNGTDDIDFWLAQTEILLSALLYVAHHRNLDMGRIATWILQHDNPKDETPNSAIVELNLLLTSDDWRTRRGAKEALKAIGSIWRSDDRTRASVYATAQTVIWPWTDPGVAASTRGDSVDLQWLLAGHNTLYLCSPIEDQRRLAPAFGGLLNDLINQAYRHVAMTGQPIEPPLLIVVDEAGNTPMRALPEYASTLAGLGILLVTIWQSVAQLETTYGKAADTILTNHLSRVLYAGLADPATLRYADAVLGQAEIETRSRNASDRTSGSQWSTSQLPLAPAHVLRQMLPGDALLIHGTLPPAHLRTRPYFADRHLAARAATLPAAP